MTAASATSGRRALVTGATSGIGLTLVPALIAEGYEVRATGRSAAALGRLEAMGAETIAADLGDPAAGASLCGDIDVVFHVAGLSSPWGPDVAFQRANVDATRDLLAAARAGGCDGFVFVSSPSVYAAPRDRLALTEASPPADPPMNAYAATKLAAEKLVLGADGPTMRCVAIRPRAVVGPDDKVLLPRLLRVVRRGRFPLLNEGRAQVELTDVRDVAAALILADRHRVAAGGRAINIAGGQPYAIRDLVLALGAELGREIRFLTVPVGIATAVAGAMEWVCRLLPGRPEPPVTRYSLATLAWSQTFDLSLARDMLGYRPAHDALETARAAARARS